MEEILRAIKRMENRLENIKDKINKLECETPENPYFLRKGKMVISVKIRYFSRSRMTKRTTPLESSHEI